MPLSVVHAAMKRNHGPKNVFIPSGINFINGILKTSVLNYGISTMPAFIKANRSVYSRCLTGRNWISGNISVMENIPIVPLYFAKERPIVEIDGNLIMPDDDRLPEQYRG